MGQNGEVWEGPSAEAYKGLRACQKALDGDSVGNNFIEKSDEQDMAKRGMKRQRLPLIMRES